MKFLRNLLAAILGCLIAFGILFVMFFIFTALLGSANDGVQVKDNSILELSFSGPIYDYVGKDDSDPFASFFDEGAGLDEILHTLEVARQDNKIKGRWVMLIGRSLKELNKNWVFLWYLMEV